MKSVVVIGGGAAGFFSAITCASLCPEAEVQILERGTEVLEKVRVSGGGRCNVTHGEFVPRELVKRYPRGNKELLGPFSRFACGDTMSWFEERGVPLKTEDDGRVFPVSNKSIDIINCLLGEANRLGIKIHKQTRVESITPTENGFDIATPDSVIQAQQLMVAPGSSASMWVELARLGHTVVPSVPSLFTFQIEDPLLDGLAGIALPLVTVGLPQFKMQVSDNFLITHRGISGFATLKLSSLAARELHDCHYKSEVRINFLPSYNAERLFEAFGDCRKTQPGFTIANSKDPDIPTRLWYRLAFLSGINDDVRWGDASNAQLRAFAQNITGYRLKMKGKDTNKEEFVTAGGVALSEIDFKRFESKLIPNLHMAGEILNIDALTGGFNFQAAWTGQKNATQHFCKKSRLFVQQFRNQIKINMLLY
jgi:predicted Rossmann fold flavoprotein